MPAAQNKSKYHRFNIPGHPHALSFSCYKNRKFLNYDRTRCYVVDSLSRARELHNFDIWAYVIMPEHIHLLLLPKDEDYSISAILKSIKQPVSMKAIKYLKDHESGILKFMETGLSKPAYRFWQDGGGYDRNIRKTTELINIVEYIHNNPVRRGLVERADKWHWSSAGQWLNDEPGPIKIDKESFPTL